MAVNYPTSLDTLTNPTATDYLNSPSHAAQHANANDILEALEAKVGINSSAVTSSHDYKLGEVTGTDKAVGKSATQALSNKEFTDPILMDQVATPSNPAASKNKLYFKSDEKLYLLTSAGAESVVGGDKATGAEVTTGTDDTKFATPKALADAGVNTRLKSKVITATRDYSSASGDVAYTGVGFVPTTIRTIYSKNGATVGDGNGFSDSAKTNSALNNRQNNGTSNIANDSIIYSDIVSGGYQKALVKSYDSDGFTLTWTKLGSPTGTMNIAFLCER